MASTDEDGYRPVEDFWGRFDVRDTVAAFCGGEAGYYDIAWSEIRHGYGHAGDFPELLGRVVGMDATAAEAALNRLWSVGFVEGVPTAAGALIVPFLLRAAADPVVHHRHELLRFAALTARHDVWEHEGRSELLDTTYSEARYDVTGYLVTWSIDAARRACGFHDASLINLLDDPDPQIRSHAAFALAAATPADDQLIHQMKARIPSETDAAVQISLVLALAEHSHGLIPAVNRMHQLWSDPSESPAVRVAAAIGWLCLTTAAPPSTLVQTVTQLTNPAMYEALREVPWIAHLRPDQLPAWLAALLHDPAIDPPPPNLWPPTDDDPWADPTG